MQCRWILGLTHHLLKREYQERDPDSTAGPKIAPVPDQIQRVELMFIFILKLDRRQDFFAHGLDGRVIKWSIVQTHHDVVSLFDSPSRIVPSRSVREKEHANDGHGRKGSLKSDREAPRKLVVQSSEAEVHPVGKCDTGDEPDTLDGDFGSSLFR